MTVQFGRIVPVFRIFSLDKAREFYLDFLGFKVDWEHRFAPDLPVYMQVSRAGLAFHLSEHHGDGTPGSLAYVYMNGVEDLHRELNAKNYRHNRPGLQKPGVGDDRIGRGGSLQQPHRLRRAAGKIHRMSAMS